MRVNVFKAFYKARCSVKSINKSTVILRPILQIPVLELAKTIHTEPIKLQKQPDPEYDEYRLPDFKYLTNASMDEKIKNFMIIASEPHQNYMAFCVYVELLAGFLYPFVSEWVTTGLQPRVGIQKSDDTTFVDFILDQWQLHVNTKPLPPRSEDEYFQKQYRIRVIAEKNLVRNQVYNFVYKARKEAVMTLSTLMKCIENYPWHWRLGEEQRAEFEPLMPLLLNSTKFFKYAVTNYISHNDRNFTIDHDVIGRFWFHQDCLFKILHHFASLSSNTIDFPLTQETTDYMWTLRAAYLNKDKIIPEILCDPESDYIRYLNSRK